MEVDVSMITRMNLAQGRFCPTVFSTINVPCIPLICPALLVKVNTMKLTDAFCKIKQPEGLESPWVEMSGDHIIVHCRTEGQVSFVNGHSAALAEQASTVVGAKMIRVVLHKAPGEEPTLRAYYPVELPSLLGKPQLIGLEFERRKAEAEAQGHCLTLTQMAGHVPIDGNNLVLKFGDYRNSRQWLRTTLEERLAKWPPNELARYMRDLETYHRLPYYRYYAHAAGGQLRRFTVNAQLVIAPVKGRDVVCRLVEFLGYEPA